MDASLSFSLLKRDNFHELAANQQFDFVFTSVGVREALFVLFAITQGYKCAILNNGDFCESLHPIVDTADRDNAFLLAFRNQFPHLILPDEYLNIKRNTSKWKKLLPGTVRDKDVAKYESALQIENGDAVSIDKEFKISTNRLLISILKSAVQQGALVLNHMQCERKSKNQISVSDQLNDQKNYLVNCKTILDFSHEQKSESREEIHLYLQKKGLFLKRSLKFTLDGVLIRMIRYQDYFLLIYESQDDNKRFAQKLIDEINRLINWDLEFCLDDIVDSKLLACTESNSLKNQLEDVAKFLKTNLSLSSSQFNQQMKELPVIDSNFEDRIEIQQIIEFGDYRFDEAKQTGVNPTSFKNMFYRYGSEIEELTEKAYELRPRFGPGDDLWTYVQVWYLYHYEMTCTYEDYVSRIKEGKPAMNSDLIDNEDSFLKYLAEFKSGDVV